MRARERGREREEGEEGVNALVCALIEITDLKDLDNVRCDDVNDIECHVDIWHDYCSVHLLTQAHKRTQRKIAPGAIVRKCEPYSNDLHSSGVSIEGTGDFSGGSLPQSLP